MIQDQDFNGHRVKMVKIDLIDIPSYQRKEMQAWAKHLAEDWNHNLFTYPRLAAKDDGRFDCIDGQHTVLAAQYRGHAALPCAVLTGIDHQSAAAIFSDINTERKRLTPFDVYRADLEAGREWATVLNGMAARYGIFIARGPSPYNLQAIAQAKTLIASGNAENLEDALAVLTQSYDPELPENASRLERKIVVGTVDLVRRAKRAGMFDRNDFIRRLRKVTYKRRGVTGLRLTPESIERDFIPAMIEQGHLTMPALNSAQGNAVLFGRALAIAVFGAERSMTLYS